MILAIAALVGLCTTRDVGGVPVSVCEFSIGRDDVELYWRDASGRPIGSFARLDSMAPSRSSTWRRIGQIRLVNSRGSSL
jgi:uncharacterized protein YigE (DUF2233 family)